jgi:hypothetical protein
MTTPTSPPCWPNDPDYLDGKTEIELPSERYTKVFWDADIIDLDDKNKGDTILGTQELFKIRFRVEAVGKIWQCMTGDWVFDVGFTPIGREGSFMLSSVIPASELVVAGWRGCDTLCIEVVVDVPPGTIQIQGEVEVYAVAAQVYLRCCSGHIAVAGYEDLGEYEFFQGA